MTEEVIQADREAAANWCAAQPFPSKLAEAPMIRAGEYDHHSLVQAFARHRLAHLPTDLSEERAREVLEEVAGLTDAISTHTALRAMHQYAAELQVEVEALKHDNDRLRAALNSEVNRTALGDTQADAQR